MVWNGKENLNRCGESMANANAEKTAFRRPKVAPLAQPQ
jgi:hypothetical protein